MLYMYNILVLEKWQFRGPAGMSLATRRWIAFNTKKAETRAKHFPFLAYFRLTTSAMADLVNLNNSYEAMERALKRLGVFIVDDTEEIRRGMPGPLVALMRKLLFQTSVMVMKIMLLRGCPSHITDKKVVLAVCDLLREQMKYNPVISIEQFFTPVWGSITC